MNIVYSFLSSAFNVEATDVSALIHSRISESPFSDELFLQMDGFLKGEETVQDDLWKFSVALNLPHQLLCDSFKLQQQVNQTFDAPHKVV